MCHPGSRSAGIIGRSWGPTTRRHRSNRRASCRCYRQQSRTCSAIVGSSEPARLCRLRKLAGSPTLSMLLASRRGAAGRVPARTTSSAWDTASRLQASARPHLHLLRADSSPRRVDKHRGWVGAKLSETPYARGTVLGHTGRSQEGAERRHGLPPARGPARSPSPSGRSRPSPSGAGTAWGSSAAGRSSVRSARLPCWNGRAATARPTSTGQDHGLARSPVHPRGPPEPKRAGIINIERSWGREG
jgi:hypothetical protein